MANLNIRVDDTLKKQAEVVFSELGISLSAATTMFLKQVVRCNGIPFELKIDPFYSESNQRHLRKAIEDLESGKGKVHELIEDEYE
ncbi:MAG TPA: type II toxin-antitoxin system antitoxin, RelB/DinJ family [Clostridiales bacterium]|nr:type II toxin-antitoxin system antitoxin, RelB/DinJ family [Clostridiales bacterium]